MMGLNRSCFVEFLRKTLICCFSFDHRKTFFANGPVWVCVFLIASIAAFLSIYIYDSSNYAYHWVNKADYVNQLVSDFKVPLSVLGMLIPLGAILAVHHKSMQARHHSKQLDDQITQFRDQNIFLNYFKHKEEFSKYMGDADYPGVSVIKESHIHELHSSFYPDVLVGDYAPSEKVYMRFEKLTSEYLAVIDNIPSSFLGTDSFHNFCIGFDSRVAEITSAFNAELRFIGFSRMAGFSYVNAFDNYISRFRGSDVEESMRVFWVRVIQTYDKIHFISVCLMFHTKNEREISQMLDNIRFKTFVALKSNLIKSWNF